MTIIWFMVPEIWSATDIIFCHFGPFLPFYPPMDSGNKNDQKNEKKHLKILSFYKHKWQSYDVWFLKYRVHQTNFFVILDHFLPFYPPNNPKNQNFEKMKKTPGDIILYKCTKNHDHMLYCSWDMVHDGCNYFSFWAIFCPFTPLTTRKIKILKNWKKHLEILSFYTCVP